MERGELWTRDSKRFEVRDSAPPGSSAPPPAKDTTKRRQVFTHLRAAQRRDDERRRQAAIDEYKRVPRRPPRYASTAEALDHELVDGCMSPLPSMRNVWAADRVSRETNLTRPQH